MEDIVAQLAKIKSQLDAQTDFVTQVREIIYQVSGVNLAATELVWQAPNLILRSSPLTRNLILRHRERILALLADRFDRAAPRTIR
ncbi:MAG: hypothetical protein AAB415_03070 [Patescibacteria group bacterium]